MEYLVFISFIAIILIIYISRKEQTKGKGKGKEEYRKKDCLLTPTELNFYKATIKAINNRARLLAKVRIADIIETTAKEKKEKIIAFNKIAKKHFDFVLCDKNKMNVIAVIELDDKSHNSKRAINRDNFVNNACKTAELKIYRFKAQKTYNSIEIEKILFPDDFNNCE